MKKVKAKEGQIFAVPLAPQRYAFGQLIRRGSACCYMAAFDLVCESPADFRMDLFEGANVLFLGNFFDVLIKNGRWPIVSEAVAKRPLPFPRYRVSISGKWIVESWDQKQQETVTSAEAEKFPFRENQGPIFLEEALQYHFGFREADKYLKDNLRSISASYVASIGSY